MIKGNHTKRKSAQNVHFNWGGKKCDWCQWGSRQYDCYYWRGYPRENSALKNQNTENKSDEDEDDETIEEFQFEQTETENSFYITSSTRIKL